MFKQELYHSKDDSSFKVFMFSPGIGIVSTPGKSYHKNGYVSGQWMMEEFESASSSKPKVKFKPGLYIVNIFNGHLLVYMTKPATGTVVEAIHSSYPIGHFSTNWETAGCIPYDPFEILENQPFKPGLYTAIHEPQFILFMISEHKGTVIASINEYQPVGAVSNIWDLSDFRPYNSNLR